MGRDLASGDLAAAAQRAHRELDAEVARVLAHDTARTPACEAGCSYCCHVHVDATQGEIMAIANHLRSRDLASFVARLRERVQMTAGMDYEARWEAKIPCALLAEDGKCTVYQVRPLRCRAFHSCSRDVCRAAFAGRSEADPDPNLVLERTCNAVEEGYERALSERGFSTEPVLLEQGLLEALTSR